MPAMENLQGPILVDYTADLGLYKSEKPYELYQVEGLDPSQLSNVIYEPHDISSQLENIRDKMEDFTLELHSFCYMKHHSQIPVTNEERMIQPYAMEVNGLLKEIFDTEHVVCYDVRRRMNRKFTAEEDASTSRSVPSPPVNLVHTDHTPEGGWNRIRRHLNDREIEKFCSGKWRARIVNVWRPLNGPVTNSPLGLCDYRSVLPDDRLASDHVSAMSTVEVFQFKFNSSHRWYYLDQQNTDEICIFIAFDSHPPGGVLNYVPHAAMSLASEHPSGLPRESIETRTIVFTRIDAKIKAPV